MGSLRDSILAASKLDGHVSHIQTTESMIIEQHLNKLFYVQPNYDLEIKMLQMQAKQKSSDRYGLHASSMLESDNKFCYREQVLSLFYEQMQGEQVNQSLKRIFEEGNFIGEKWQRLFIRGGLGKPEDMDCSRFVKKYDLSYTPDAIITINKKRYIVEIKSQNTFQFKKQSGHPTGEKQCLFYQHLEGIHNGFALVEDKNDQTFKVLMVKYEEEFLGKQIERLENIQVYKKRLIQEKKMVKGICPDVNCKRASECSMKDACFNVGKGRIKLCIQK